MHISGVFKPPRIPQSHGGTLQQSAETQLRNTRVLPFSGPGDCQFGEHGMAVAGCRPGPGNRVLLWLGTTLLSAAVMATLKLVWFDGLPLTAALVIGLVCGGGIAAWLDAHSRRRIQRRTLTVPWNAVTDVGLAEEEPGVVTIGIRRRFGPSGVLYFDPEIGVEAFVSRLQTLRRGGQP